MQNMASKKIMERNKLNKASLKKIFFDNYQLYLLMLPGIIATFIFSYIPMYGVQIALKTFVRVVVYGEVNG
ncbi:MAG TPA: hypothetical protein GXX37_15645 [Clostridiaceae bacterium]|nr:hypothetical protein [Clostridiaceae bacterium]